MPAQDLLVDDAPLVSMGRFGATLHRARRRSEESLAALSKRSGGRWMPDDLVAVERGVRRLSDLQVREIAWVYSLPMAAWSARGTHLVLDRSTACDLDGSAGPVVADLDEARRTVACRVVAVSVAIGIDVVAGDGLDAVAAAAELSPTGASELIGEVLAEDHALLAGTVDEMSAAVAVPAAGIAVACTAAGTLVLASRGPAERAWVPAAAPLEDVVNASRGVLRRS